MKTDGLFIAIESTRTVFISHTNVIHLIFLNIKYFNTLLNKLLTIGAFTVFLVLVDGSVAREAAVRSSSMLVASRRKDFLASEPADDGKFCTNLFH